MVEMTNIAHVSLMVIESARLRKESRGLHYSSDYPEPDEKQRLWTVLTREKSSHPWEFSVGRLPFNK
jgi:L-aspartate oxidase